MPDHGAVTIKEWMQDLVDLARSGQDIETSAGAEPGRSYAYLAYHVPEGEHSILVFGVEEEEGRHLVRAHRFQGTAEEVREKVDEVTHGR